MALAKLRNAWGWPSVGAGLMVSGLVAVLYTYPLTQPSQPVTVAQPVVEAVAALGRLEPLGEVIQIFASSDRAKIEALDVYQGQYLRRGTIIARLDTYARRRAALQSAQQQVRVAQAQLAQVQAGAKQGEIQAQGRVIQRLQAEKITETAAQEAIIAQLTAELANAELEDRRYQQLLIDGAVSTSLRDSKHLTMDIVQQRLNQAQAELSRIRQSRQQQVAEAQDTEAQIAEVRPVDVALAQAQVAQAQAGVTQAEADLDLAVVRAPQDGQVLKIHARPGEVVGNQGIISLGQTQSMVAVAEIYELDINRLHVGQKATVTSKNHAFADLLHGEVIEVGLEIGKQDVLNTDPAAQFDSRVVEVKVRLDPVSSQKVAGLSNLSVQVVIDAQE